MVYDSKSKTITLTTDSFSEFHEDSAAFFLHMMRDIAQMPTASQQQVNDLKILEAWLGCEDRELTNQDEEKMSKAWKAYMAMGIAPSIALQQSFDYAKKSLKSEGYSFEADRPPTNVIGVFKRLMASDKEIELKQKFDVHKFAESEEGKKIKRKFEEGWQQNFIPPLKKENKSFVSRIKNIFLRQPKPVVSDVPREIVKTVESLRKSDKESFAKGEYPETRLIPHKAIKRDIMEKAYLKDLNDVVEKVGQGNLSEKEKEAEILEHKEEVNRIIYDLRRIDSTELERLFDEMRNLRDDFGELEKIVREEKSYYKIVDPL